MLVAHRQKMLKKTIRFSCLILASMGLACGSASSPLLGPQPRLAPVEGAEFFAHQMSPHIAPVRWAISLSAAQARGRWHWRVFDRGTPQERAIWVRPDGTVRSEVKSSTTPEGVSFTLTNAWGVEQSTTFASTGGVWTRRHRSGQVSLDGCHHAQITYDERSRVLSRHCFSAGGDVMVDADGCSLRRWGLTEQLLPGEILCLDAKDQTPAVDAQGIHRTTFLRDPKGDPTEERFFDTEGKPTASLRDGCYGLRTITDVSGDVGARTCLGLDGKPTRGRDFGVSTTLFTNDSAGCVIKETYADETGKTTLNGAVAGLKFSVGYRCEILRVDRLRLDGQLLPDGGSVAVREYEYDEEGKRIKMRCFNEHLNPMNCNGARSSYGALITWSYDSLDRIDEMRALHITGIPSHLSGLVPHVTKNFYNRDGRLTSVSYYDNNGKPTFANETVGQSLFSYDNFGLISTVGHFDWEGNPVESVLGCHGFVYSRDTQGRLASIECKGPRGAAPTLNSTLFDGIRWPAGAARVEILRKPQLANIFVNSLGKELRRIDCFKGEERCYK